MNFSGIYKQQQFWQTGEIQRNISWVEVQELPGSNCYCDGDAMETLRQKLEEFDADGIHFIDSGNYHYMSCNGELFGKANKAEFYYRQLITYEPEYGAGYLEFGNFLNRQGRYEQSMEVYREWEKQTSEKKTDNSRITQNQIEAWKKEASSK